MGFSPYFLETPIWWDSRNNIPKGWRFFRIFHVYFTADLVVILKRRKIAENVIRCFLEKTCLGDTPKQVNIAWCFLYLLISNGFDFVGLNYRFLVPQKWSKTPLVGEILHGIPSIQTSHPDHQVFGGVWFHKYSRMVVYFSLWTVKKDKFFVLKWCSSPTVSTGLWFHPLRGTQKVVSVCSSRSPRITPFFWGGGKQKDIQGCFT